LSLLLSKEKRLIDKFFKPRLIDATWRVDFDLFNDYFPLVNVKTEVCANWQSANLAQAACFIRGDILRGFLDAVEGGGVGVGKVYVNYSAYV